MFSENYSVCLNDDGSPREIRRNGPVVTYKAIGFDTGRPVAMQLIPLATLSEGDRVRFEQSAQAARQLDHDNLVRVFDVGAQDDHLVFVSEHVEGESAEDWIDEHGPMPADAVLRIGFQAVNVLAAADERGVHPCAIQPANVIIVPGAAADGGWPRIKLRHFGLPAVKLNSEKGEAPELVPSMPPQFASPEQRENRGTDIRSEIFSLGATMWFLLSGSVPPWAEPNEPGPRLSAPDVPRFVRNLVSQMLRTDPEERPQDLAVFAEKIHGCLQKAERRTAFTRSFSSTTVPRTEKVEKRRVAPVLALAAAIVALAALGAFFLPQRFADRKPKPLGVLVGVPETTPPVSPVSEPPANPAAVPRYDEPSSALAQRSAVAAPPPTAAEAQAKSSLPLQLAANDRISEPQIPAEGPAQNEPQAAAETLPLPENIEPPPSDVPDSAQAPARDLSSAAADKTKAPSHSENVRKANDSRGSKRKSRRERVAKSTRPLAPLRVGSESARLVGTTGNGNWVLRLRSGERVIAPPLPNLEDAPIVTPRHIRRVERPVSMEDEPPITVLPPDQ